MIQAQWYSIRAWQVDGTKENLERPGTWRSQRGNNGTVLGGVQIHQTFHFQNFTFHNSCGVQNQTRPSIIG